MKYLFLVSHPAHFHMFRHTIGNLKNIGHDVTIVIRPKDVLVQLCKDAGWEFYKLNDRPQKNGKFRLALALIKKIFDVDKIVKDEKPDLLIGSDGTLAIVGWLRGIPSFECGEDDAEAVHLYARLYYPFYTNIICPSCCSAWKWTDKKIGCESYHELGYLHPNQFQPNIKIVEKYGIDVEKPYFVIRFAQLNAHHDGGIKGINSTVAEKIINILEPHGRIIITSERPLESQFEKYRLKVNPLDMHDVMAFADMFVGDSQTMSAEAGVLGVPFVHFNDFVGRLSYINELEQKYQIGYGHKTNDLEGMLTSIQKWLDTPNRKELCQERRQKMLSEKIDYAKFLTWFIENFPESKRVMKENPDYQYRFK